MFERGATRRRTFSVLMFLFVIMVCAAFAAHERLHELETPGADQTSHFETIDHDHPYLASPAPTLEIALVAVGTIELPPKPALAHAHPAYTLNQGAGPPVAGAVRLHDLLSIYLI